MIETTLEDFRPMMERCSNCLACKWLPYEKIESRRFGRNCPSAAYYSFNTYSARGRFHLGQVLLDGRSEFTEQAVEAIHSCTACGSCDVSCKITRYNLEPLAHNIALKERAVELGKYYPGQKAAIDCLEAERTMLPGERHSARTDWAKDLGLKDLTREKAEYAFFAGCQYSFGSGLAEKARFWAGMLRDAGVDLGYLGKADMCCGGRAKQMGFKGAFEKQAGANIAALKAAGVTAIVTPCSDCYHAFKRQYATLGLEVKTLHVSELAADLLAEGRLKFKKSIDMTVTYHDPCHLGRLGEPYVPWDGVEKKVLNQIHTWDPPRPRYAGTFGVYDAPRSVLKAIPGLRLKEMQRVREYSWCCGAGGGCSLSSPELSSATASERLTEARSTGADAIVTACPWCLRNLEKAVDENGRQMKAVDITELVALAV
ncbi:MAG: (Fe-S)-binding protein [Clostridiales Family XIII bacterium]|nr:(Fe-S)-binding protein [Clostridiales Family XIII bacterium]